MARIEYFRPPQVLNDFARNPGFVTNVQDMGDSALVRFSGPFDVFIDLKDRTSNSAIITGYEIRTTDGGKVAKVDDISIRIDPNTTGFGSFTFDEANVFGTNKNDIFSNPVPVEQADFLIFVFDGFVDGRGGFDRLDLRNSNVDTEREFEARYDARLKDNGDVVFTAKNGSETVTLKSIEQIVLEDARFSPTAYARNAELSEKIVGDSGDNVLRGGRGDDTLKGGLGDDVLLGGPGADVLDGGVGVDTASYRDFDRGGGARLDGVGTNWGMANGDTFEAIENLVGSSGRNVLIGSDEANRLNGLQGNDLLIGREGDDVLIGGPGNDRLKGGDGQDVFVFQKNGGDDVILDWEDGNDLAIFRSFSFDSFNSLAKQASERAGNLRIELAEGESVEILGLTLEDFSTDDVVL